MKIQHFIQLVLLLGAGSVWAMPVVNLNQLVGAEHQANCQRNNQENDFRNLVHKASFIGEDDRKPLSKNLATIGFSAAEQEQAMRCTGQIRCPGASNGKGSLQSAGLICPRDKRTSGGHCAADRIASAAHIFVDKATNRLIPGIERCVFQNYRGGTSRLEVTDVKVIDPSSPANNPYQNMRADKVVVRLKEPIAGCDPYDMPEDSEPPPVGTNLVAITQVQEDQPGYRNSEPMAYNCNVTRTFPARGGGPSVLYTNCDANGGGSGGFVLTRNSNNRLAVTGMFIRTGALALNGQPYDEANKNYTVAVGTNADFIQMAENPGQRPQLSQGVTSPLRPASGQ